MSARGRYPESVKMTQWLHARARIVLLFAGLLIDAGPSFADEYYSARNKWDSFIGGQLNISTFAFRDVNRNGVYDLIDYPMAGVAFEVTGGGRTISHRTNNSGFGNFPMSVLKRDSDIVNRGEYTFVAMIPGGWVLTTDNASQRRVFEIMPGAPGDMVSSNPYQPIGLAQELTITGRVAESTEAALLRAHPPQDSHRIRVRAISAEGKEQEVVTGQTGSFSFAVTSGQWTVVAEDGVGDVLAKREVQISVAPVFMAALVPEQIRSENPRRITRVGFDDLVTIGIKEIPFGYYDLNWHNWVATHHKFYNGEGYVNNTISGEFVAYNSSGHPVKISRERPFDFIGGYFGSAWLRHAEGETLRVKAWSDDALAYDETIRLSALGPIYFSANFRNITTLEFATQHYWQFICDDLEFYFSD
jgi:hypothetical protein